MTKPYRTVIDVRSATQDLTTVDSVKLDLGLDPLDTSRDAWILAQIKQASSSIATMCNRMFGEETISDYFTLPWCYSGALELSRIPVTDVLLVDQGYKLLATLPYDLERAANLMIKGSYYAKSRDPSIRSESIPGVMSFDYGSSATVKLDTSEIGRLIAPYKIPSYG
jgi:hypothetical protein